MHTEFDSIDSPEEFDEAPEGFVHLIAPAHWASYFVNGDASGLDDGEAEQADAWCEREGVRVLDVRRNRAGEPHEPWFCGCVRLYAPEVAYAGGDVTYYLCELINGGAHD